MKNNRLIRKIKRIFLENKIRCIIVLSILILFVIALIILFNFNNNDNKLVAKKDNNIYVKGIIKEEMYKGLKFYNIKFSKDNDIYILELSIKNTTKEAIDIEKVNIPIKDKDGKVIVTLLGYIGDKIGPDEVRTITTSTSIDLSNAYKKEIEDFS